MIRVKLGRSWCDAIRSEGSLSVEWLARLSKPVEVTNRGKGESWLIEATPAEWDELALWCYQRSAVPIGSSVEAENFAATCGRVLARIEDTLKRMALHPAYQGRAVKAHSAVVLPAYRCKHPRARWWPTPRMAILHAEGDSLELEWGWLKPVVKQVRGWTVTKWHIDTEPPAYYG